jgi:hypothetical protein
MGESTDDVFKRLGLSVSDLKKKGSAGAFQDIIASLSRLNQSSASKAASGIFGRMGAANAVQISRSGKEFAEAMAEAAPMSYVFDRIAKSAALIERTVMAIKRNFGGLFAGIAEGAIPGIQKALDMLKSIDLTSIGQKIGKVIGAVGDAIGSGQLTELLTLSLAAGFEQGAFYGERLIVTFGAGLAAAIPEALAAGFQASAAVLEAAGQFLFNTAAQNKIARLRKEISEIQQGKGLNALIPAGNRALMVGARQKEIDEAEMGINDMQAGISQNRSARAKSAAVNIQKALTEGMGAAGDAWSGMGAAPTDSLNRLKEFLAKFKSNGLALGTKTEDIAGEDLTFGKGLSHRTEGNVFEKMGFVTDGAGGAQQEIVRNTARTVDAIDQLREIITYNREHGDMVQPGMNHEPL